MDGGTTRGSPQRARPKDVREALTMSINLDEIDFFSCVWFANDQHMDLMGVLYRLKEGGAWEIKYRFRYHHPESGRDPFDDKDRKSWYQITKPPGGEDGPEDMADKFEMVMRFSGIPNLRKVDINGDVESFLEVMAKQPEVHLRFQQIQEREGVR
jgi:hypothetical protein